MFAIGENTAILKYKLYFEKHVGYNLVAPTAVKKYATSKGNAKKEQMYEVFYEQTKIDLFKIFDVTSVRSPINDIVDSYFLCQMASRDILILPLLYMQRAGAELYHYTVIQRLVKG